MSVTREEVRQYTQKHIEWLNSQRALYGDDPDLVVDIEVHTALLAALDDAERWQQAARQQAAWVMCTPEFIAQMEQGWSEPVRVRIKRRVAEDVLAFEAARAGGDG